jgi:uncharacterized membrane protein YbhN (UPF0104 family)
MSDDLGSASASQRSAAVKEPEGIGRGQLIVGGLVFLLLTVGVFWYQFYRIQTHDEALRLERLQWGYLPLILFFLPFDTFACALRIWVVSRVLQPGIGLWTCLKAEWANVGIAMLTPSNSGGGFGQVYMLNRGGASVGTAMSISLITFLGSMIALLCIGLYSILFSGMYQIGYFFYGAMWLFTLVSGTMILGAVSPGFFRVGVSLISRTFWGMFGKEDRLEDWWPPGQGRTGPPLDRMGRLARWLVDIAYTYMEDARRFVRVGRTNFTNFAVVCLLSLTFILSRSLMGFLCLRFLGINTSTLVNVLELQIALIFLIYFAPTPGSSGLAETASLSIMAPIVPIGFAPYFNLLWRFSTFYLAASVGLLFLLRAAVQDAHKLVSRRGSIETI